MQPLFTILFIAFSISAFSQDAPKEDTTVKLTRVKSVPSFIDSIRKKIFLDTLRFKREDIILTTNGNKNYQSYSPLFFINILYKYKLDIVGGNDVRAFTDEILVADKIESITLLNEPKSLEIFGGNGKNGVIMIQLKEINKVNLRVAGFKFIKTTGDNFHQSSY